MGLQIVEKKPMGQMKYEVRIAKKEVGFDMSQKSQVVAVFDISGSMEFPENRFYTSGIMAGLATRVLALALTLDDDGNVPVYPFNHSVTQLREDLTEANLDGYINRYFSNIGGGTNYAPFIQRVMEDAGPGDPMLVLVFTDGDNDDKRQAEEAIKAASHLPIFWQFFGIYGKGRAPGFSFLKKLDEMGGRRIDNAGFMELGLYNVTDTELYASMLSEYKDYPAKAKVAGLLDANGKWDGSRQSSGGLRGLFSRR